MDGGLGKAFAGAVVITIGMFFPCFVFTIAGHSLLEKLVHNKVRSGPIRRLREAPFAYLLCCKFLASFFDGLCGAVIGVIAVISFQILKPSVEGTERNFQVKPVEIAVANAAQSELAAVLYLVALGTLYKFNNKWVPFLLVVSGAVAGQFLFVD